MALNTMGLGKGLDALIRETGNAVQSTDEPRTLPLSAIQPNPEQPRRRFSEKALDELSQSIKSQGLLQPILVRPLGGTGKYEIIAGERRYRACTKAGLKEVPVVIKNFNAQETLVAALIENLQREDLNPVEEALGIQMLKNEFALSQEDLAQKLGKSRSAIANSLRLLSLAEDIQHDLSEGKITAGHARALLGLSDSAAQKLLHEKIVTDGYSVREAEGLVAHFKASGNFELTSGAVESPDAQQETTPPTDKSIKKKPQSSVMLDVQEQIARILDAPCKVTGTEQSGKISIRFDNKEMLDAILAKIGQIKTP